MIYRPTGSQVSFEERIADILERYGETHIVHQAIHRATPALVGAIRHTQDVLHWQGVVCPD